MPVYTVRRIIIESYPVLLASVLIGLAAGSVFETQLSRIEGTLVVMMVPLLNGTGGNLGCILAARLTSALHLGMIEPKLKWQKVLGDNLGASVLTSLGVFLFAGAIVFSIAHVWGMGLAGAVKHMLTYLVGGILLMPVIIASTVVSAFLSFKKGLDPDNVVIPLVTAVIDVSATVCLLIVAVNIVGV
jgi:mgtE-like transporter